MNDDMASWHLSFVSSIFHNSSYNHAVLLSWLAACKAACIVFAISFAHQRGRWSILIWLAGPFVIGSLYVNQGEQYGKNSPLRHVLILSHVVLFLHTSTWGWIGRGGPRVSCAGWESHYWARSPVPLGPGGQSWITWGESQAHVRGQWQGYAAWLWRWGVCSPILEHALPLFTVFIGCLPLYFSLSVHDSFQHKFNIMDVVAALICMVGVLLEAAADAQLYAFHELEAEEMHDAASTTASPPTVCTVGLWGVVRHPRGLGALVRFLGYSVHGIAAVPAAAVCLACFACLSIILVFVLVPIAELRTSSRMPQAYERYAQAVPSIVPSPSRLCCKGRAGYKG